LELLAFQLPYASGMIAPFLDARRDQVYTGLFAWEAETLKELAGAQALPLKALMEQLKACPGPILFTGDGVPVFRERIAGTFGSKARFAPAHLCMQRASAAAVLAADYGRRGKWIPGSELMPFYLRTSQAEQRRVDKGDGCRT
jgi:tRNA threonylcarbamoyladenosine biosynthesis protein TsaB